MVAEATPETQAAAEPTQATPESQALEQAASLLNSLEPKDAGTETPPADGTEPEPTPENPLKDLLGPTEDEVKAREEQARADERTRLTEEQAERDRIEGERKWQESVRAPFNQLVPQLRAELSRDGVPDDVATKAINLVETLHGRILPHAAVAIFDQLYGVLTPLLPEAERETFNENRFKPVHDSMDGIIKDFEGRFTPQARKGLVSAADLESAKRTARQELVAKLLTDDATWSALESARNPATSTTSNAVVGSLTSDAEDKLLLDPNTDIKIVNQILDRRNGR